MNRKLVLAIVCGALIVGLCIGGGIYLGSKNSSASIAVPGADGERVSITAAGEYTLSNQLSQGQIYVKCSGEVILHLAGINITNSSGPCIYVEKADKVTLILEAGTENMVADGESYVLAAGEDEPNAAIFSQADLVIEGEGSLTVNAAFDNGIQSKGTLTVNSGKVTVNSKNDGIKGKEQVFINGGSFSVASGGDAISCSKGALTVSGGSFDLVCAEGADYNAAITAQDISAKGLKAETDLTVSGGEFRLNTADDGLHANGNLTVSGGTFSIETGDDGIHCDQTLTVTGGTIAVTRSYEGLEGLVVCIESGDISLVASDDGLNAAGGNDSSGGWEMAVDQNADIIINGGTIAIDAGGDGIDSNGRLHINGGTVIIDGPENGGNGALDFGSEGIITGGRVFAVGASGMSMNFTDGSTQCAVMYGFSSFYEAGTQVTITDSAGAVIGSYTSKKSFSSMVFSDAALTVGETYTVTVGSDSVEFTQSDTVCSFGTGGMGGFGGHGGGRFDGDGEGEFGGRGEGGFGGDNGEFGGGGKGDFGGRGDGNFGDGMPDGATPPEGGMLPDEAPLPKEELPTVEKPTEDSAVGDMEA